MPRGGPTAGHGSRSRPPRCPVQERRSSAGDGAAASPAGQRHRWHGESRSGRNAGERERRSGGHEQGGAKDTQHPDDVAVLTGASSGSRRRGVGRATRWLREAPPPPVKGSAPRPGAGDIDLPESTGLPGAAGHAPAVRLHKWREPGAAGRLRLHSPPARLTVISPRLVHCACRRPNATTETSRTAKKMRKRPRL